MAQLVIFGVLGGALVFWFWLYEAGSEANARELLSSIGTGIAYTLVMSLAHTSTARLLSRYFPLRSTPAVIVHVGVQSIVALVSFLGATLLFALLLGWDLSFFWSRGLISIGIVAFLISLIANGYGYLTAFYKQLRHAEKAALEAEVRALRAQINPHFLFNSLNSIAALIRTRPAEAETVTEDLADLFRYSLRASQQHQVTLGEELESVALYLAIERARFRHRLQVVVDVPSTFLPLEVPSLLLQPLVENAIKHGVGRTTEPCTVTIRATPQDDNVYLTITDTGPGFDIQVLDEITQRGTGLRNVQQRLTLFFGDSAELRILPNGIALVWPATGLPSPEPLPTMPAVPPQVTALSAAR